MPRQICAQHAVDKARGAVTAIQFCQLDRFIDGNFDRHIAHAVELEKGEAQNVAVYNGELLDGVFRRELADETVQFDLIGKHAAHQRGDECRAFGGQWLPSGGKVFGASILKAAREGKFNGMPNRIYFKEDLESESAGFTTSFHDLRGRRIERVLNIRKMNVDRADGHADHIRDGAMNLGL